MSETHNGIPFEIHNGTKKWKIIHLFPKAEHTADQILSAKQWCYYNLEVESIKVLRPNLKTV